MGKPLVVASSALMFIPSAIAFFRQSMVVAIAFTVSTIFSVMYHVHSEKKYAELDIIWASLAILVALVMLTIISMRYPPWSWRIVLPVAFGMAAILEYFFMGQADDETDSETDDYATFHSVWHLLIVAAATFLVVTPVDLRQAHHSYVALYHRTPKSAPAAVNKG